MRPEDWKTLLGYDSSVSVLDNLSRTPFDELMEIDLKQDLCHSLSHMEGKYVVPFSNGSYSEMYQYSAAHLVHPDDLSAYQRAMAPEKWAETVKLSPSGVERHEFRMKTMDGGWRWTAHLMLYGAENGLPEQIVRCYIYDIHLQKERESGHRVPDSGFFSGIQRDKLTGLLLEGDFFALAQERLPRLKGEWCVIAIDVEHFKLFTDWHGVETGLELLSRFGEILNQEADRLGGLAGYRGQDDFCMLLPYDRNAIQALHRQLRDVIAALGSPAGFSPLFGICMVQSASDQMLEIFNHAALTAESIKGDIQHHIRVYDPALHRQDTEEYRLLIDFQHAIEHGEIVFWLQPQCRVSTSKIVGAESLARWIRPDGSLVSPAVFVPVLEKYGIISQLDRYIWDGVCAWIRKWMDMGHHFVPVSVNVSRIDIFSMDVPAYLTGLMKKYDLPPEALKIEITESAYADDTAVVQQTMEKLRQLGFLVLMDDFGSGYSSLNMLRSLNVDVIKLDAQFLRIDEEEARKGVSILESVINMAKNMSTPIIVEGVESREQVQFLSDLGCRYMQGYFFHRPMPVESFEALVSDETHADFSGFEFKPNQQLRVREFMDENVYNDAMLNNILGPVAFYRWKDSNVDIIRFNQQFYTMVGLEIGELNERKLHIQDYLVPEDRKKLFSMLERAFHDRLNGAKGVVRVYKPNNTVVWLSLQVFFMDEDENGKRYYASAQDITELQYINADLPGGYYRCSPDNGYEFQFISQNFQDMTGYSAHEIRELFDNKLINMVHPLDQKRLQEQADALSQGKLDMLRPFRIKHKKGGYIYLAEQNRLTDRFGDLCWQCVVIDVTEMMHLRNQMRLLARFSSSSIVFLRPRTGENPFEVAAHGLENQMGLNIEAFQNALNDGSFAAFVTDQEGRGWDAILQSAQARNCDITLSLPGKAPLSLRLKIDQVDDEQQTVERILVFTAKD